MPQGLLPFTSDHPHQKFFDSKPGCLTRVKRRFFYLLDGNPRRLKTLSISLLFLCFILYLTFFYFVSGSEVIEESPNVILADAVVDKRLDFEIVTIDKICSKLSNVCYSVIDKKRAGGDAERHLVFDNGLPDDSDTLIALIPPRGESFDTSDTRIWNINHANPASQYIAGMLAAPFITNTLSFQESNMNKSVVEIGLGGGSLDMALHNLKPKMNITAVEKDSAVVEIAEKWFGVVNNEYRKSIVSDGIDFINNMVNKKETVDVILLDACDENNILPCPGKPFRQPDTIRHLKSALNPTGVLVVNILAHEEDEVKPVYTSQVISSFTSVFRGCFQMKMTQEINTILICFADNAENLGSHIETYNRYLRSLVSSLDFEYILGDVNVSEVL